MGEEVIEGLKFKVIGKELIDLAAKKVDFHTQRAALLRQAKTDIANTMDRVVEDLEHAGKGYSSTMRNDPAEDMRVRAESHEKLATYHRFIVEHLQPASVYVLTLDQLSTFGIQGH